MTLSEESTARIGDLRRVALLLEYDGARYRGFQWQPDAPTIQSALELAIEKTTGEKVRVVGAGRTDSGVHARGQVAAFLTRSELSTETLLHAFNHYLHDDISVHRVTEADLGFDPRRDAVSRRYHYSILNSPTSSPLLRNHTCHIRGDLDIAMMDGAASHLVGEHDFSSFSRAPEVPGSSTTRRITETSLSMQGRLLILEMEGNAFLTHQVRRTAGALVEVGLGRMIVEEFRDLVDTPRPGAAGPTLSPAGLCLEAVRYPTNTDPFLSETKAGAEASALAN